jgi:hypothetical protein
VLGRTKLFLVASWSATPVVVLGSCEEPLLPHMSGASIAVIRTLIRWAIDQYGEGAERFRYFRLFDDGLGALPRPWHAAISSHQPLAG